MATAPKDNHNADLHDLAQMVVGAGALALPIAMSEDTWDIAAGLPLANLVAIVCAAVVLVAGFVYTSYFRGRFREHWPRFLWRVVTTYGLTLIVASGSLALVGQAHWFVDPFLALKQTLVVALPASFAATIVDNLS